MVNSNSSKVNLNQIPSMNSLRTFKLNDGEKLENDLVLNENQNMLENSNILCSSSDSQAKNKVPTTNDRKYTIKRHNGSPPYMAPEIFDQDSEYDPFKADIWALGVTFYQMVMGKLPWQTSNLKEMKKSIKMGFFEFEVNEKNGQQICPVEFQRLIKKMCVPKVSSRLTIDQILADPLFAPFSSPASNSSSIASGVSRSLSGLKSHLSQLGNLSQLNSNCSLASPHPENKQFGIATSTSMFQKLSSGNGLLLNMREKNSESGTADRDKNQCLTLSNSFNPALKKFEKVRRQASLMRSDFARIRALNQLTNFSYNIQKPNVVSSLDKSQLSALPSIKKPA
ncbi:hypothetical protein TRFO_03702 [Tritrichomonas foetus]|uniref:Protein kinase domain-containing protein n=1 Tax=Tritrichomonas foetus TaxID=1144522 RepID=A0A1J4KRJ8_9EUKA|nr:hypothetical protein TRFO_03702 [Tritrichomonas foetus]|eukprot:OHT12085.1 hypothetical protein TRFO_03702 [Tritrichomonas foetus]